MRGRVYKVKNFGTIQSNLAFSKLFEVLPA